MWLLVSVNCLCLERASLWDFVVLAVVVFLLFLLFFFLFTGGWLKSSVRVFSFFREVFVLFSFKFRSSFAPRRVASCQRRKRIAFRSANSRNWERCMLFIKVAYSLAKTMDFCQLFCGFEPTLDNLLNPLYHGPHQMAKWQRKNI
jgi:hypothetical protein